MPLSAFAASGAPTAISEDQRQQAFSGRDDPARDLRHFHLRYLPTYWPQARNGRDVVDAISEN